MTRGELHRYLNALLKDSEHLAAMIDNVPSVDNLDFIMESDALGHTVMDQQQGHESLMGVASTVTLEDVSLFLHLEYVMKASGFLISRIQHHFSVAILALYL